MIKAILFDFDGVITIDKTGSFTICKYISSIINIDYEIFSSAYRKYNEELLSGKTNHSQIWESLCLDIGINVPKNILIDSFRNTALDESMLDLIKRLKRSHYKIALVTDNKQDRIEEIFKYKKIGKYFDVVAISSEIGSGKENEEIFIKTIKELKVNYDECIFIDNQRKNLIVPKMKGIKTIYYNDEEKNVSKLEKELIDDGVCVIGIKNPTTAST